MIGLEPTTLSLRVRRSTIRATSAYKQQAQDNYALLDFRKEMPCPGGIEPSYLGV